MPSLTLPRQVPRGSKVLMPARPAQDARVRIEEDGVEREVSAAEAIATLSARRSGE